MFSAELWALQAGAVQDSNLHHSAVEFIVYKKTVVLDHFQFVKILYGM